MRKLLKQLKYLPELTSLNIDNNRISHSSIMCLCENLQYVSKLISLSYFSIYYYIL